MLTIISHSLLSLIPNSHSSQHVRHGVRHGDPPLRSGGARVHAPHPGKCARSDADARVHSRVSAPIRGGPDARSRHGSPRSSDDPVDKPGSGTEPMRKSDTEIA